MTDEDYERLGLFRSAGCSDDDLREAKRRTGELREQLGRADRHVVNLQRIRDAVETMLRTQRESDSY